MQNNSHIHPLTSKNPDVNIVGGKGSELINLTSEGFVVPEGFVIGTDAYNQALEISDDLKQQILAAFDELSSDFVAVRSSATAEDGSSAAWAGQLETYLYTTEKTLIENIKKCWQSLQSDRAISYAKQHSVKPGGNKVAVVIQRMIDSDVSGVAFTVNPITGAEEIMIEAGFGQGEAVVSGHITPDNYIVNKKTGATQKNISSQAKKLEFSTSDSSLHWVELRGDIKEVQKLRDQEIAALVATLKDIELYYKRPMDVEWTIDNGKLYILQARPITTL